MEHKLLVAVSLRAGLAKIKEMYTQAFLSATPFKEQWQLVRMREEYDIHWNQHKELIESNFAWKSKKLLSQIQGD